MEEQIVVLKRLVKAWHAAQEYDYCPGEEAHENLNKNIIRGGIDKDILTEYKGSQPSEIVDKIIDIIESFKEAT